MSLVVTGTVSRINEREAGPQGNTWVERTLVVEDWGQTQYVTASRELAGALPEAGETVALVCAVRTYKAKDGEPRFGLTGLRRHAELTKALNEPGLRTVSA